MKFDFYSGFEGEPELVVEHRDGTRLRAILRAWDGYFDGFMAFVEPRSALGLHYHLVTEWETGRWQDPDPSETLGHLRAARERCSDQRVLPFADALIAVVEQAAREGGTLTWIDE